MLKIIKNTLLNHIPDNFAIEKQINPARIYELNSNNVESGIILYLCEREIRARDNFALQFAIQKSNELNLQLKIIHPRIIYDYKLKQEFIERQIRQTKKQFDSLNFNFEIANKTSSQIIEHINPAILILDFNPILKRSYLNKFSCKIYEIDGHNITPARYVSDKQEYNASTLRRKIYHNITPFLTEFENLTKERVEADFVLKDFIENKLSYYAEFRNHPDKNIVSGLSKYLNLGFISSQRVALEIVKSNTATVNKEAFLEELIVRKELADNFCLFAKNFKDFSCIPNWSRESLNNHKYDMRSYLYSLREFEGAQTHDKLWNATQGQLIKEGVIHSYLRMYWAKKILEWTETPDKALKTAIYLNDKYAYDSPSANGYVGILWALAALHDRAFADYLAVGKVRRMTYKSIKNKYNLMQYINEYNPNV